MKISQQVLAVATFILALAWAGGLLAETDEQQLDRLLQEFLAGASINDPAVHRTFWADELVYTSSAGERFGKGDILSAIESGETPGAQQPSTVYTGEDVDIRLYGDMAVVAFRLVGTQSGDAADASVSQYFNTGTFLRREGRWQAVAWQATRIPAPAP